MMQHYQTKLKSLAPAVVLALTLPMTACAQTRTEPMQEPMVETVPFSITFDTQGTPLVVDMKGNVVEPTRLEYPLKTEAVESINAMTMVKVRGSQVYIVIINGVAYKFIL